MDLTMPGVDGLDATRHLRRSEETKELPVIAVSANPDEDFREAALRAGCDGYVTKPIDFAQLNSVISSTHWLSQ